jgi:hypothetical protein
VESGVFPIDAGYPRRQPVDICSARLQEMEAVIMFAIIALVLLALAWAKLRPRRTGR